MVADRETGRRIAYLGPEGTFSEEAALLYRGEQTWELLPFASIAAAISAAETRLADEAMVPIENSLEGSVAVTLDSLIFESNLLICHELILPVHHFLLGRPGLRVQQAKVLFSHPQPVGQCRRFIDRCLPGVEVVASLSTAKAVSDMLAYPEPAVAIATRRAAMLYGAAVLAENVEDSAANVTRFVVLAQKDSPPTGRDKTSLAFALPAAEKPGVLHEALGEFAARGISLTKIESRPTKETLGRYVFLLDLEGHREDPEVAAALAALAPRTSLFKVFGSYPRA